MAKAILIFFALTGLITPTYVSAQDTTPRGIKHGSYAELYIIRHDFSDGLVSINYEIFPGERGNWAYRVGIYPDFESTISIPVTFTRLTNRSGKGHFEFGFGAVVRYERWYDEYEAVYHNNWDIPGLMLPVMYRYGGPEGLFFRGGVNVIVSWPTIPLPSVSFGYSF